MWKQFTRTGYTEVMFWMKFRYYVSFYPGYFLSSFDCRCFFFVWSSMFCKHFCAKSPVMLLRDVDIFEHVSVVLNFLFEHVHLILLTKATWVASSWSPDHFLPFKCLMHSLFLTYTHENSGLCSEKSLSTCFSIGYSSVKVKKHYRF